MPATTDQTDAPDEADATDDTDARRPRAALPLPVIAAATVVALLAAAAVLVIASRGGDDTATDPGSTGTVELTPDSGNDLPPLETPITDPDGGEVTLTEVSDGRPMVVNFFASWCTPCIQEMPDFEDVHQRLGDDVQFVGLSVDDARNGDDARIVEQTGVTYEWYQDTVGDVINATGAIQMPTTIFVSADGEIVDMHSGALDADGLTSAIEEHLGVPA